MLRYLFPILSLALLLGYAGVTWSRPTAADAVPYHAEVRAAIEAIPREFDGWKGSDHEVPQEALELLDPNKILSRSYHNDQLGLTGTLLIVHCKRAQDMAGHYPPQCYPGQGWQEGPIVDRVWDPQGADVTLRDYLFTMPRGAGMVSQHVENFLVLPDGRAVTDMSQVYGAAADHAKRHFGAAQVQVITRGDYTLEQRETVRDALLTQAWPAIETILRDPLAPADATIPSPTVEQP